LRVGPQRLLTLLTAVRGASVRLVDELDVVPVDLPVVAVEGPVEVVDRELDTVEAVQPEVLRGSGRRQQGADLDRGTRRDRDASRRCVAVGGAARAGRRR